MRHWSIKVYLGSYCFDLYRCIIRNYIGSNLASHWLHQNHARHQHPPLPHTLSNNTHTTSTREPSPHPPPHACFPHTDWRCQLAACLPALPICTLLAQLAARLHAFPSIWRYTGTHTSSHPSPPSLTHTPPYRGV